MTDLAAVVMAAGLGTRMKSATPKHLHPLLGRRLVDWVVEAVRPLGADPLVVVLSPQAAGVLEDVDIAIQQQPLGTGDSLRTARDQVLGMQVVLPSGPQSDLGYMSVTQWPTNKRRFFMAYYSNHNTPLDPQLEQWSHPDIYLADVLFNAAFIKRWRVSDVVSTEHGLKDAVYPDPDAPGLQWHEITAIPDDVDEWTTPGLVDAHQLIDKRPGIIYFVSDIEVGPTESGFLQLGYDGPVRVWVNGEQVFEGPGSNPIVTDKTTVRITTKHGTNRIAIALDTNGGKAWGIVARYEVA
jgi:hypothetical protein